MAAGKAKKKKAVKRIRKAPQGCVQRRNGGRDFAAGGRDVRATEKGCQEIQVCQKVKR